jgi:glyoxylase-like metal-dependent hydrolase (beta-lactamase superfamily II)
LSRLGAAIHPNDLTFVGNLITPPFSSIRFDTAFFTAALPPGQTPLVIAGELDAGDWLSADAALTAWELGRMLVSPPTVSLLQTIRGRPVEELALRAGPLFDALSAGAPEVIYFSPQVQMIPLFCNGLPPTYYTNAFLVGHDPAYIIDPGAADPDEQHRRLFTLLDDRIRGGARLAGVVLTHHHPDHVGAAEAVARRYSVPVWAHPWTMQALAGKVAVSRQIRGGEELKLGTAPHDGPWRLEAILTPGHTPGHLCFYEATYRLLFVGDMASTLSSVVIAPPEGDITDYLESLRRLQALPSRLLLPAHGPVSARPEFVLDEAISHRRKREEQLMQMLTAGPRRVAELAQEMYRGAPTEVMPYAEKQVLAGLLKLEREGRAARNGTAYDSPWRILSN